MDKGITQFDETTSPQPDDVLAIVTNTDTIPTTKKVKFSNLSGGGGSATEIDFGTIFTVSDSSVRSTGLVTTGSDHTVTGGFNPPDTARTITGYIVGTSGGFNGYEITVHGTDLANNVISSTITFDGSDKAQGETALIFKTVTSVDIPSTAFTGFTITLGCGIALGVPGITTPSVCLPLINNGPGDSTWPLGVNYDSGTTLTAYVTPYVLNSGVNTTFKLSLFIFSTS